MPACLLFNNEPQLARASARGRSLGSLPSAAACFTALLSLTACGGSMKASTSAEVSAEGADGEANFDVEGDSAWEMTDDTQSTAQTSTTAEPSSPQGVSSTAQKPLLGARHDLLLAEGSPENCKCLAAVLGPASAPAFVWTGRRPAVDAGSQLVVALASEGIDCPAAQAGASYMGYEVQDGNVVVHVEAAVEGRPVTHGAIIPRPAAGKQVYVEPAGKIPHGKSLNGQLRCALGAGG